MENIFNYDNKFFRALSKLVDCVLLSALWVIFCIPVFTIGASTSALYYAAHRTLVRGKGYVVNSFWTGFKSNFKKSTCLWLIQLAILLILAGDIYITNMMLRAGYNFGVLSYLFVMMLVYIIVWIIYTYSYTARFEVSLKNVLKNSAIFAVVHLPWSFFILALLVAVLFIVMVMPPLLFLMPGALFASYELILEKKVFRKYMSEEDLQKELEDDRYDDN